jgi:hypothetical protein
MFAKKKVSMLAKSDIYRKLVARKLLNDLPKVAKNTWNNFDPDDVLHYAGLTTYKPAKAGFGGLGVFLIGAAVGSIVALMLAPKPGAEIRTTVKDKAMGYINKQNLGTQTTASA